jgi:hypothetical protein
MAVCAAIAVYFVYAARRRSGAESDAALNMPVLLGAGAAICAVWWPAHYFVGSPAESYNAMMTAVYAGAAMTAFAMAAALMNQLTRRGESIVLAGMLIGACGMFLYDQINMALVTGPVAGLFWIMLAMSASTDDQTNTRVTPPSKISGGILAACGVAAVSIWIWQSNQTFPWDTGRHEALYAQREYAARYKEALAEDLLEKKEIEKANAARDAAKQERELALKELDAAIAISPRSGALIASRIRAKLDLGLPVADDMRRFFALDRANAAPRWRFAIAKSDLPLVERQAEVARALWLDEVLPAGEAKHLNDAERKWLEAWLKDPSLVPATQKK